MKRAILLGFLILSMGASGRFGIGIAGIGEYGNDYSLHNYAQLNNTFFGLECHISSEALPYMFIEPVALVINNPVKAQLAPGIGLRVNVAPRLGKFFLGPYFGVEGDLLFYNPGMEFKDAVMSRRLEEFFYDSSPRAIGTGFGGLSLYFGKSVSLDCHYRYLYLAPGIGIEMAGAGLTFYINW